MSRVRQSIRFANLGDAIANIDTMRSIEPLLEDLANTDLPEYNEPEDDDYTWPTTLILEDTAD